MPSAVLAGLSAPLRPAAVLIPLMYEAGEEALLLTRRAEGLRHHAGQISFPGGSLEPQDADSHAAAIRETTEEVGISEQDIQVIGSLAAQPTVTGFEVTPVVAKIRRPQAFTPDPNEVAEVFQVPLSFLFDPANRHDSYRDFEGITYPTSEWRYAGHRIWGATGWMIRQMVKIIEIRE